MFSVLENTKITMKEYSWVCTLITQISLCLAIYLALNIGQPQKHVSDGTPQTRPKDLFFMSVVGGYRPLEEQIFLLKQMAKVAKTCRAEFVVNISELGEDDPLTQNATQYFQSLKVPWYTTRSTKGRGTNKNVKRITSVDGRTLEIIVVDTELFQGPPIGDNKHQLLWLKNMLEESTGEWRIIVCFHPLIPCNGTAEGNDNLEYLQHIFLRYGVNAYLSGLACAEYENKGGAEQLSNALEMEKGPYLTSVDKIFHQNKEGVNGFLLHRVSSFEFVTYSVSSEGEVVHRTQIQPRGKEVI